jgi:hypothetical protein
MTYVAAFVLRLASVACRSARGHWTQEHGFSAPCLFEQAADELLVAS